MSRQRAVWLVLGGILSVQAGAALAKMLFGEIPPTTMVWLRLAVSAVILVLVARPRLRDRSRGDWLVMLGFAAALGGMNWAIYQSFARIPLGIATTIEFVGPLTLAVLGSRRARDLAWVALAAAGVLLLGFAPGSVTLAGVGFALLAGALWAAYILLSRSTGQRWPGLEGLAMASLIATVAMAPAALAISGDALLDGRVLLIGAAVGLLSSVIPYSLEMMALRDLKPSVFGILMSLEPAAAALAALVVLQELLSPLQVLAMACVIVASIGATRGAAPAEEPVPN